LCANFWRLRENIHRVNADVPVWIFQCHFDYHSGFGVDEFGRITNKLDQAGAEILRYEYDPNGRLTNRWSIAKGDTYYSFDPVGNLTNINYPNSTDVSFAFDPLNQLTNMIDGVGTTKYTYTSAGQLLTEDGPFVSTSDYNSCLKGNNPSASFTPTLAQ